MVQSLLLKKREIHLFETLVSMEGDLLRISYLPHGRGFLCGVFGPWKDDHEKENHALKRWFSLGLQKGGEGLGEHKSS